MRRRKLQCGTVDGKGAATSYVYSKGQNLVADPIPKANRVRVLTSRSGVAGCRASLADRGGHVSIVVVLSIEQGLSE
jgi:hypothetical protein